MIPFKWMQRLISIHTVLKIVTTLLGTVISAFDTEQKLTVQQGEEKAKGNGGE